MRRYDFFPCKLISLNKVDERFHQRQVHFRMIYEKEEHRAPKLEVFDSLAKLAGGNLASQFNAPPHTECFSVAQRLSHRVMVGRLPDTMLHPLRHRQRNI